MKDRLENGIGEENIKKLVQLAQGNKLAIETIEELFAGDWVNLEYAEKRIIELQQRLKEILQSIGLEEGIIKID